MRLKRLYEIIEPGKNGDFFSKFFDYALIILIILNVVAVILGSFDELPKNIVFLLKNLEIVSIIVFSIEYLLRIITAKYRYPANTAFRASIKYIMSPMAIIDLIAILPFYLPKILKIDLRALRMLRLTRLFRMFKINRYSSALKLLGKVIRNKKGELLVPIFVTLII